MDQKTIRDEFIQQLRDEAISCGIFDLNIMARMQWWVNCIVREIKFWKDINDETEYPAHSYFVSEVLRFLNDPYEGKWFGDLISMKKFVELIEDTDMDQIDFSGSTKEERSYCVSLFTQTFINALNELHWSDIEREKRYAKPEISNLDCKTWYELHLKLLYPNDSELNLQKRIEKGVNKYVPKTKIE